MMNGVALALILLLQHGPATAEDAPAQKARGQKPAAPKASPQVPAKEAPASGDGAVQPSKKSAPNLEKLLEDPEMHIAAAEALEAEVAKLRETLGSLVSEGEMGVELLQEVEGPEQHLRELGVSEERAEAIRIISNEVRALRAKLRLIELRSPEDTKLLEKDPLASFDPLEDQATHEAEELAARLAEQRGSKSKSSRQQRSLYPSREALLAFKQGDYGGVIEILKTFEPREIEVDALYAYGCALVEIRNFETARQVFERVKGFTDRKALSESAGYQLTRMQHLEHGIVGPGAKLKERSGQ
ncbi:MAG: hypothetical protein V2A76_09965 [Planctomycetota bacterium]